MSDLKLAHLALTKQRAAAYATLFGGKPEKIFPYHGFYSDDEDDKPYLIDVFIFPLEFEEFPGRATAAVTNGMSDYVITDAQTGQRSRCELIQYFHDCDFDHAERLFDLAYITLFDGFSLGPYQTIAMPDAVLDDSPLRNSFFMPPLPTPHRNFQIEIEGVPMSLLWHVPISDEELAYKKKNGPNSLIERMQTVELPWIFDEAERPSLLD